MPSDDLRLVFQLTQRDDLMEVRLTAPGGECRTETEPAAIFTARAIRPGPAALAFSVWQDGGQIASVAHPVRALEAGRQPGAGISARSHVVPVQPPAPPWGSPWQPSANREAVRPPPAEEHS